MKAGKALTTILGRITSRLDVLSAKRQAAEARKRYTEVFAYDRAWEEVNQVKSDVEGLLHEAATTAREEE